MLSRHEQTTERWIGAHQAIDNWLQARQLLLIEYFKLAGLPPYEREHNVLPETNELREFCGSLVDYVSAGHFEIYDQLISNAAELPQSTRDLANRLFPLIADTTEVALDFNDTFGDLAPKAPLPGFDAALSQLGEALELRMEFEDELMQTLEQHQLIKAPEPEVE
ncbi:anti-RNA polymerase sigma 70 factor [Pseudidiomarina salinarum]|uniref:Anti-RNA polymerase sigma 70 factor n=1 Tax=Pseudidiomarina salinarum TaxID=435908 RepID=A0A094IS70_9GAMM|nr:Rsd/AlgQ family anti-sigma factor [Pseudidiomarina salinarum]KFZ30535.1 anti-RNA polymerase sigma 70 factor [Pseudidiomarina salinarum]RUO69045.1 Rsd/AlgQ family anti-sigma factor [Pseudidiomarina salinarum]